MNMYMIELQDKTQNKKDYNQIKYPDQQNDSNGKNLANKSPEESTKQETEEDKKQEKTKKDEQNHQNTQKPMQENTQQQIISTQNSSNNKGTQNATTKNENKTNDTQREYNLKRSVNTYILNSILNIFKNLVNNKKYKFKIIDFLTKESIKKDTVLNNLDKKLREFLDLGIYIDELKKIINNNAQKLEIGRFLNLTLREFIDIVIHREKFFVVEKWKNIIEEFGLKDIIKKIKAHHPNSFKEKLYVLYNFERIFTLMEDRYPKNGTDIFNIKKQREVPKEIKFNEIVGFLRGILDDEQIQQLGSTGKESNFIGSTGKESNCIGSTGKESNCIGSTGKESNCIGSIGKENNCIGSSGKESNYIGSTRKESNYIGSTRKDNTKKNSRHKEAEKKTKKENPPPRKKKDIKKKKEAEKETSSKMNNTMLNRKRGKRIRIKKDKQNKKKSIKQVHKSRKDIDSNIFQTNGSIEGKKFFKNSSIENINNSPYLDNHSINFVTKSNDNFSNDHCSFEDNDNSFSNYFILENLITAHDEQNEYHNHDSIDSIDFNTNMSGDNNIHCNNLIYSSNYNNYNENFSTQLDSYFNDEIKIWFYSKNN